MQQSEELSSEAKEELGGDVNAMLGDPESVAVSASENPESPESDDLPESAKKRLGMQEKRHKKEMKRLQQQLDEVYAHLGSNAAPQYSSNNGANPYTANVDTGNSDDRIHAAVLKALQIQKEEEKRAKGLQDQQYILSKQRELANHLDKGSEKYEDFDDVVKSPDAPYTEAMQSMAMVLHDIPGIDVSETLYKIGKDPEKLRSISKLRPIDQAKEVVKLAIALMSGNGKASQQTQTRPLGQVKNNPVTSQRVNDNTSVSDLRKRMREGGKKWSS